MSPTPPRRARATWIVAVAGFASALPAAAVARPAPPPSSATTAVVMHRSGAADAVSSRVAALGGRVTRELPALDGLVVRLPSRALDALRTDRRIRSVTRERRVRVRSAEQPSSGGVTLARVRELMKAGDRSGAGVDVALVDTGVSPVPGLDAPGQVVDGPDFSDSGEDPDLRHLDAFGHGTHLAGIVAGVAPGARLVDVKVAEPDGSATLANLLGGIDWVIRHRDRAGLRVSVLNVAFGLPPTGAPGADPVAVAVTRAARAGITVVASAGNGGSEAGGLDSPASAPAAVAVGASDDAGAVAPWSSRGDGVRDPDVVAPGVSIVSARVPGSYLDDAFPGARHGDDGFRGSGTSQAAAAASGAAALLLAERPDLAPSQVKALLRAGANALAGADASAQGSGLVDVSASSLLPAPAATTPGMPVITSPGGAGVGPSPAIVDPSGSRWSGSRWSGSRWSGSRWSGSRWSGSRWSGSRWSGSRWSGSRWSGSRWSSEEWPETS